MSVANTGTIDDVQLKILLEKKVQTLQVKIEKEKSEKEKRAMAKDTGSTEQQLLHKEVQNNEIRAERLARLLGDLQVRNEAIKVRQKELDGVDKTEEEVIQEIDKMITKDEKSLKTLSAAVASL
jgi:hypothetical protein